MYKQVRSRKRAGRNAPLGIAVAACVLIFAVVLGGFLWGLHYQMCYRQFVGDLSNSTVYAYERQSLQAQVDGELLRVSGENMYGIYRYIISAGAGRVTRTLPEAEGVLLDYGDGSTLELWDVDSEGYAPVRERSLLLCYTDTQGSAYIYATDKLTLETIMVRYLSSRDNEPWTE